MQIAYAALIPLNLLALELTECRTTYVVLLIVCPVMLFQCGKKKWGIAYLAALFALATAALLFDDTLHFLPRVNELTKDIAKRLDIWGGAIGSILDAPVFGRGYNTYVRIRDLYDAYDIAKHSHNLLLEVLMDFGIAGTAVLLGYFSINISKIIRLHRQNKCHQRYALTVSVIVCVLLHGLLDITMLWPQTSLLIMYVVGFSTEYDKGTSSAQAAGTRSCPCTCPGRKTLPAGENENSIFVKPSQRPPNFPAAFLLLPFPFSPAFCYNNTVFLTLTAKEVSSWADFLALHPETTAFSTCSSAWITSHLGTRRAGMAVYNPETGF